MKKIDVWIMHSKEQVKHFEEIHKKKVEDVLLLDKTLIPCPFCGENLIYSPQRQAHIHPNNNCILAHVLTTQTEFIAPYMPVIVPATLPDGNAWNNRAENASVVHSHWVDKEGNFVHFDERDGCPARSCYCHRCNNWLTGSDEYPCRGNYCPNCGAKMDETEEEK